MAERSDQRTREVDTDVSTGGSTPEFDHGPGPDRDREEAAAQGRAGSRLRARLRSPFTGLFSLRVFLVILAVTVASMLLVGTVLPLGGIAGLLGIALVGFIVGVVRDEGRYLEMLLAGAFASGVGSFLDYVVLTLAGIGIPLVALGTAAGAAAGALGHYFGRDLRNGLTREV
jgi:predicted membrane metal-binding protein